ncbi:hypothetical protein LY01_02791 [Nonlabens xylanidelens]|uniref:Uncharacterized protein n=1 Tax=Nonlabens xylanidelens TaxID=191564 RepID=A0A2S6IET8_9FLAO|nr:hypothetical protein LY01_02791 [Nonlabens xylanidelens]
MKKRMVVISLSRKRNLKNSFKSVKSNYLDQANFSFNLEILQANLGVNCDCA